MAADIWLWILIACLVWYCAITVYVSNRGVWDVKNMLARLGALHNGSDAVVEIPPAPSLPISRRATWLTIVVVGYGVAIVGLWAWMVWAGDREWLATLVLFGPRWLCGVPWPFLAVLSLFWRRRLLWLLAMIGFFIVGPMMGFQLHWPAGDAGTPSLRIMTCNVDQQAIRTQALAELIADEQPDVVALEEVSSATRFIWPATWNAINRDEFTLASRWPITEREHINRPITQPMISVIRFTVALPDESLQIFVVHLQSPRPGLQAVLDDKHELGTGGADELTAVLKLRATESERDRAWIEQFPGPKIILGDFNLPADSTIFRRYWGDFANAFSRVGWGFGFTKNSAEGGFSYGSRIDHVLYSPDLRCLRSWVGPDVGSDHLPLLAEFE